MGIRFQGGQVTVKDLASFLTLLMSALGLFMAWWNRRVQQRNHRILQIELRGVKGYKFRAMWRQYAAEHDIPINGEDTEEE